RPPPVLRVHPDDRHPDVGERAIDDLLEDRALVLEIQVKRAARDAGFGHDLVDLRVGIAPPREDLAGGVQDTLPPLDLAHTRSHRNSTTSPWKDTRGSRAGRSRARARGSNARDRFAPRRREIRRTPGQTRGRARDRARAVRLSRRKIRFPPQIIRGTTFRLTRESSGRPVE